MLRLEHEESVEGVLSTVGTCAPAHLLLLVFGRMNPVASGETPSSGTFSWQASPRRPCLFLPPHRRPPGL